MAAAKSPAEPPADPSQEADEQAPASRLARLRTWATGSPLRGGLVAGLLLGLMGGTIAAWMVLADLAAPERQPTLADALEQLDEGDLELAAALVDRIQDEQTILTQDYGGPLFVLGAIRAKQADQQWAAERRRRDFLIASKYLDEARSLGVPEDRRYQALYLLGKAFIGSEQLDEGVEVLTEALESNPEHETEIHNLLAQAHYFASYPKYEEAIKHLDIVLADPNLTEKQRADALLRKARALSRLGRHAEAQQTLASTPTGAASAKKNLVNGQLLIRNAEQEDNPEARQAALDKANKALIEAEKLDKLATTVSADSQFLRGRIEELLGQREQPLNRYLSIRKRFGMGPAGIASSMAEGDMRRRGGE